ncbi:unnamed protein product [Calypogeia fissa]
MKVEMSE